MIGIDRFREALASFPAPGFGNGCNPRLLGAANRGICANLDPDEIFKHIREAIPPGRRRVSDGEIIRAIDKAMANHRQGSFKPKPRPAPVVRDGVKALGGIIAQGSISTEVDLWEASPIRLPDEPQYDPALFLQTLYLPDDLIFIGERYDEGIPGKTIRTRDEWISHFRVGGRTAPHLIINPLTGHPASKKNEDGETLRGDNNVAKFIYCMIEFDNLAREEQIRFWSAIRLSVICIVDTGGKSLHGLVDVQKLARVETMNDWKKVVRGRLYDRILNPLGIDIACSNPARLSRLPGHFRKEKGAFQRMLWLSQEGRPVNP